MAEVAALSQEKQDILRKAWERMFWHVYEDTTTLLHWQTTIPSLGDTSAAQCSEAILYELFDLAAYDDMDTTMLRFLRARKFNVEEALKMLNAALLWRKSVHVRDIMQAGEAALSPKLVEAGMYFIWGHDQENRPIVFFNIGNFIPPKTPQDSEDFQKYLIYHMETARYFIGSSGIMALMDLSNFARKHIDFDFAKKFAEMFQSYYPEILGRALIVGAGLKMTLFETAWTVAKYFLDTEVRRKVSFHKAKEVPQFIDAKYIPTSLGGTFREAAIRASAPQGHAGTALPEGLVDAQVAEMIKFKGAAWGTPARNDAKAQLRSLWLRMAACRPQNLYERLGLLQDGEINWQVANAAAGTTN